MAAKVSLKGVKQAEINIRKKFLKVVSNTSMLNKIGEVSVEKMQFQARKAKLLQGKKGLPGSFPTGYPKSSTVNIRKSLEKYNKTHGAYKASRGNLTFSGQLISALKFKVLRSGTIRFLIDGPRTPYKNKDGTARPTGSNKSVYSDLLDRNQNFRIIGVDDKLSKRINNIVRQFLRRALKF